MASKAQESAQHTQQELETLKIQNGREISAATYNTRGMNKLRKKEIVEHWMTTNDVQILLVQETHTNLNAKEHRDKYTCFFSGGLAKNSEYTHAGVAIVVNNEVMELHVGY